MTSETNDKSSRHSKIAGNFGEALVLYWLSKHGFECALVDHVGIDIIAAKDGERMGISVKCRTRMTKENARKGVLIKRDNFEKAEDACKDFGCKPYLAVVADHISVDGMLLVFIAPMPRARILTGLDESEMRKQRKSPSWNLRKEWRDKHRDDNDVLVIELGEKGAENDYAQEIKEWWKNHSRPDSA